MIISSKTTMLKREGKKKSLITKRKFLSFFVAILFKPFAILTPAISSNTGNNNVITVFKIPYYLFTVF